MAAHRWDPVCPPPSGLVRPVRVDPTGRSGPTRGQASGPGWRRTSRGFYVPAAISSEAPEQRVLEQSVRLPHGGAVTGWAACRLWRAGFFDGLGRDGRTRLPVPLALGPRGNIRGDEQVVLTYEPLPAAEVVVRHGVACCRVPRATFDAMRLAPDDREAVVVLDMMAAAGLHSIARARAYAEEHPGWRRIERARGALPLASEHSRSPNETRLRLIWRLDAGLPPVLVNCPLHDRFGRLLGIADLLDPVAGLVVEFDGADHRTAGRHAKDVAREDAFRAHGLEVARVTGPDLGTGPSSYDGCSRRAGDRGSSPSPTAVGWRGRLPTAWSHGSRSRRPSPRCASSTCDRTTRMERMAPGLRIVRGDLSRSRAVLGRRAARPTSGRGPRSRRRRSPPGSPRRG